MFVNVLCTIKHFRRRKPSRSVIFCNAEAAGFEPANRLRAVNCFRGSLLQPLGHASCLIPPTPFSRGRSGPAGFPSQLCLPCSPTPARHLMMPCYFIGTLSQTLTLRAAFTSSTYLLSQIPGPGRSSDDDLLNLIPSTPFSRGRSGPTGFPSPLGFPCSPTPARHLMMPCYFMTLRAAFASSMYLLSQIPGPGRSSDDDLLNSPDPLFKGAHQAFVRTRARGHRFAVLRPASDYALVP